MAVLVTGGAGFIGSHTCVELLRRGHDVVLADDYSNSSAAAVAAIREVSGRDLAVHQVDVRDTSELDQIFTQNPIDAVVHFAARKSVRESVDIPLDYYGTNVGGTTGLLTAMIEHGVSRLVFSSSCSIFGDRYTRPIAEDDETAPTNPYARSKLMCEQILADACRRHRDLSVFALRYFNPVGAHASGLIGEDPSGIPNNLMPYIAQVAVGRLAQLSIYGSDYPTPDGTGVRDYIHVVDLALGHLAALAALQRDDGVLTVNLGTGRGYSVLEMVRAFAAASGRAVPHVFAARRPGDIAQCYADPALARQRLGWQARRGIDEMCADTWRWQQWAAANLP